MSDRAVVASERISAIQQRLAEGLAKIDPHHRLLGRPLSYRVIAHSRAGLLLHRGAANGGERDGAVRGAIGIATGCRFSVIGSR